MSYPNAFHRGDRRKFILGAATLPMALTSGAAGKDKAVLGSQVRLSCNLYSFNTPLLSGAISLDEVLEFCAGLGLDAVDPTGYYFPGYPAAPDDAYLYRIKRRAFRLGLDISGTGIRNDFTQPEPERRKTDVALVKAWVSVAARLGAPTLRVFSGRGVPQGQTRETATGWVVDALRECVECGRGQGVTIALQNHWDFVKTAEETLELVRAVDSEWFAVNLDIGSYRSADPYAEIARVAPHAATWQLKESVWPENREQKTDLRRIIRIVREAGYRGYLPLETLGAGDPREKLPRFLAEVREALAIGR